MGHPVDGASSKWCEDPSDSTGLWQRAFASMQLLHSSPQMVPLISDVLEIRCPNNEMEVLLIRDGESWLYQYIISLRIFSVRYIYRVSGKKFTREILNKIRSFVCTHLIFA